MTLSVDDPRSPAGLARVLRNLNMAPAHRWGQNFLIDPDIFAALADLVMADRPCAHILEIGPGVGGLTRSLLERGADVAAVELDTRVEPALDALAAAFQGRLTVVYGDALEVPWDQVLQKAGFDHADVAGNLPYYITAPVLGRLLSAEFDWERATFMVQREVAERLLTEPGSRSTSTLGVLLRYRMAVSEGIAVVPRTSFSPAPEITSSVIQLRRRPALPAEWDAFRWVVRAGFQHRRKMLRQSLSRAEGSRLSRAQWQELLSALDIPDSARAEELTLDQWTRLAAAL